MIYSTYLTPISLNKSKNVNSFIFKEHSQITFSYTIVEQLIHVNEKLNFKAFYLDKASLYYLYTYWTKNRYKFERDKAHIDPLFRYFTSLFIYKSKLRLPLESISMSYFNSYNQFYSNKIDTGKSNSKTSSSNESSYFYREKIATFFKSEFTQIIQESNFIVLNKIYKLTDSYSRSPYPLKKTKSFTSKVSKYTKKFVSSTFLRILKKTKNISVLTNKIKFKVKLKRLFKYTNKIKINYFKLPYSYLFNTKIKRKNRVKTKKYNLIKDQTIRDKPLNKVSSFIYKLMPTQFNESYLNYKTTEQVKKRVSILTHSRFSFYKLNAVSLTRFQYECARIKEISKKKLIIKKKTSANFLKELERKIESRYRYTAIYIKDLVRITFFCIYLKNATFLANFYAFILSKLPRKRKETKLIKFFLTILKVFSAQRPERIAIRLRFQGRLNRWRRTKNITGHKGYLEYYSYKSRIEFGISQAITRKGTQGIRIWLCYDAYFKDILKQSIFNYIALNSNLNFKLFFVTNILT